MGSSHLPGTGMERPWRVARGACHPRTAPLPVPAAHRPAAGSAEPAALLCAGGCRGSPANPAQRQKKPVSLLSSCVIFPVVKPFTAQDKRSFERNSLGAGNTQRDVGQAWLGGEGRGGLARGSKYPHVSVALAREPPGTAQVARGGWELSTGRAVNLGSGWGPSGAEGLGGPRGQRPLRVCRLWCGKWRRKTGCFCYRAGEAA